MSKLQKGQSLVEYTVLVSVIAIAAIPIMTQLGNSVSNKVHQMAFVLNSAS